MTEATLGPLTGMAQRTLDAMAAIRARSAKP